MARAEAVTPARRAPRYPFRPRRTGDPHDGSVFCAGAAYAFDISDVIPNAWTDEGCGLAVVSGLPTLVGTGTLAVGSSLTIALSNAASNAFGAIGSPFVMPAGLPAGTVLWVQWRCRTRSWA